MWTSLIALVLTSAPAAAEERTLALTLTGPEGALVDAEVPLPYSSEHPLEVGRRRYVLAVRAEADGEAVDLVLDLKKIRRSGKERWLKEASLALAEDQRAELSLSHRAGDWTAVGQWAATSSPPAPTEPASALRYVLVWADAGMADDPRTGGYAPRAELADRGRADGAVTPFRVVMEFTGEILEAKAVPADDMSDHCHFRAIPGVNDWDRQFFLQHKDLAQVTAREVTVRGDDGTAITLAAGVALVPEGGGYRVDLDGLSFVVDLPADAVGTSYRPSPHFPSSPGAPGLSAPGGILGEAAGVSITDRGGQRTADGVSGVRAPLVVTRAGCLELSLQVDPAQLQQR